MCTYIIKKLVNYSHWEINDDTDDGAKTCYNIVHTFKNGRVTRGRRNKFLSVLGLKNLKVYKLSIASLQSLTSDE